MEATTFQGLIEENLKIQMQGSVVLNAPMSRYTSYKIGGNADCLVAPACLGDIELVLAFAQKHQIPLTVIGKGTNLLVSDLGIEGIVVQIGPGFANIKWLGLDCFWAEAGVAMSFLAKETAEHGLTGLEWAVGIPGNLGGAIMMNAGAYGKNMRDCVTKLQTLEYIETKVSHNTTGQQAEPVSRPAIKTIERNQLLFSYRQSGLKKNQIVLGACLQLQLGDKEKSQVEMAELLKTRRQNQPLDFPSAGSVFVNPTGDHAGRLVEAAGCKGMTVGGAEVSLKHGNFIINKGGATAEDVLQLITLVQKKVKTVFGVDLETEVRRIGKT